MKDSWLVDLHVHTPASDDYRGEKEDAEYIQIIKMAKENNIDVIGIIVSCVSVNCVFIGHP